MRVTQVRASKDLSLKFINGDKKREMELNDIVRLSSTNSVPTLNGEWKVRGINEDDRTFVLQRANGDTYGEKALEENTAGGASIVGGIIKWAYNDWTDGSSGKIVWATDYVGGE